MCGYNLRDCEAAQCPECGHHLKIINGRLDGEETTTNLPWLFGVTVVVPPMLLAYVIVCGVLIETGLVGCAILVLASLFAFYATYRGVRRISRSPAVRNHITDRSSSIGGFMRLYMWFIFYAAFLAAPMIAVLFALRLVLKMT